MEKRTITAIPYTGRGNPLVQWTKLRHPLRVLVNFVVVKLCKYVPSLRTKNIFYKLIGVKIGRNVRIAPGVTLDFIFPELIEIGDNSVIGFESLILTHEFLVNEWRRGKVIIGSNVVVGAQTTVMPGVTIGDHSTIAVKSLVNKTLKPHSKVVGIPIRRIM